MKKFLLSCCALIAAVALNAAEYTLTMSDIFPSVTMPTKDNKTITVPVNDGFFTLTLSNENGGSTYPAYNTSGKDLRLYAKNEITITCSEEIAGISFEISTQGLKRLATITATPEGIAAQGSNPLVWAGSANSVSFTVGEKADYGTDGAAKAGQFDFTSITITTGNTPVVTKKAADLAFDPATVDYVVGEEFIAPDFSCATNAAVTFTTSNANVATVDDEGTISVTGNEGKATITATSAENDTYYAGTATCVVTVTKPVEGEIANWLVSDANGWVFDDVQLPEGSTYVWKWDSNNKYLKGSAYVGGSHASDSYAVSPEINLANQSTATLTFTHAINYASNSDNVAALLSVVVREAGASTWEKVTTTWPEGTSWTWVDAEVDLSKYIGKTIQVAFHYTSTDEVTPTWEVKNFLIVGDGYEEPEPPMVDPAENELHYLNSTSATCDFTLPDTCIDGTTEGTKIWQWKSYSGAYYLNASAYGGTAVTSTYAVSPVIDLTAVKSATCSFEHAAKFQTNLTTDCHLVVREAGASEWEVIEIPTWPTAGSWTFVNSGDIALDKYVGKKIEMGFNYVSTTSGGDTWEIRDLQIQYEASGVDTVAEDNSNAPVEYFNLQGMKVANPQGGIFIRRQGNKVEKLVIR